MNLLIYLVSALDWVYSNHMTLGMSVESLNIKYSATGLVMNKQIHHLLLSQTHNALFYKIKNAFQK
jgi:hypothetical protein